MNKKQLLSDLRITLSGKMRRSAFWLQTLMLIGLTLLVLIIWFLLSMSKLENAFSYMMPFGKLRPKDIFTGWQTWVLGIYGVWLLVLTFCMQVRRMHDVGKSALLPALWWALSVGGVFVCVNSDRDSGMIAVGGLMIMVAGIVAIILLINTLRGSKVVEGEQLAAPLPSATWGVALAPWALSALLYLFCVSNWVEFFQGCDCLPDDEAKAIAHFTKAAEKGHKVSKTMLLINATSQRDPEALPKVRQLAEDGGALWQFMLSGMYKRGYPGLEQNEEEALKWLMKSAQQGFEPAVEVLKSREGN